MVCAWTYPYLTGHTDEMVQTYRVREGAPASVRAALSPYPELLQDLLFARGIADARDAQEFLAPHFERDSHDPFLLPDMAAAVDRISAAVREGEPIAVWSDYDCDGVPGGVMLAEFLRGIGGGIRHYIPDRHLDGFGLNDAGLAELAEGGIRVVITVDCGTTDLAQAHFARERGIDLIITDHHLPVMRASAAGPAQELPAALVINPHRTDSTYPFKELCGAGVAWKLVQAILTQNKKRKFFEYPEGKEKWLLDLVGLATLSDMVPLRGENRMLASYGLLVMRRNRRPGLRALLKLLRITAATLTEDDLAFMIAPRINAASRMERAETAAELLAAQDAERAAAMAIVLNRINDERKGLVAATVKDARKRLAARDSDKKDFLIVIGSPDWRPGILGLVAQKLAEEEGKPAFVWGRGGGIIKGSCRSDGACNIVDIMRGAADVFRDFGGHEFSGGFSLTEDRVHELAPRLRAAHAGLQQDRAARRDIELDRELDIADAPHALGNVRKLSPFGEGNRKPLFLFPNISIERTRTFGKTNDHLELYLNRGGARISAVSFFATPDSFQKKITEGTHADVVAHLEVDFRNRPRLRVVDVL